MSITVYVILYTSQPKITESRYYGHHVKVARVSAVTRVDFIVQL